jgi:uncharacterized protein (DUF4415 family)
MPKEIELTEKELAEVARRRVSARAKARRLIEMSDPEEDAAVLRAAEADPDAPPMTDEQLQRLRPAHEVLPSLVRKSLERKRGRPPIGDRKRQVTLRLDPDILDHFRAGGPGWQTAINDALRQVMKRAR